MTVKERLVDYIKFKGISVNRFEKTCGLSTGYVGNMRVSIQPDKLTNIAHNYPDLNTGWLMTGEGNMIKGSVQTGDITNSTIVGGNVHGNGNKITHYTAEYDACRKEVEHLKELLVEKEKQIADKERQLADKERIIELLSKK